MITFSQVVNKWPIVLEEIKNTKITVHAWLIDGEPAKILSNTLYIAFKNTIHMETIKKPNNTKVIENVLFEVLDEEIEIECIKVEDLTIQQIPHAQVTYSTELLFVLENGTRLSNFSTLINMLNVDDRYIVSTLEQDELRYKGRVSTSLEEIHLELQINKYTANNYRDLVYKVIIYGNDLVITEEYTSHIVDLVQSRKEVKNKYVLWDGISQYYCNQAYKLINQVENRMRSFIIEFLCRKIGQLAFQKTLSAEIKESIDNNNQKTSFTGFNTALFNVEFRELGEFLFKEFDDFKDKEELIREIRKCKNEEEFLALKSRLPNSNWNRFFNDTLKNKDLHANWNKLIKYRNIVAHNKLLPKAEFDNLSEIVKDILSDLENAIESLDNLKINDEEQKKISLDLEQIIITENCDNCGKEVSFDETIIESSEDGLLFFCNNCYVTRE